MLQKIINHLNKDLVLKITGSLLFTALMINLTSCSKIENINSTQFYDRADIVAIESAFTVLNSSLMESEGSFLNSTCNSSSTYRTCSVYSTPNYHALYDWSSCRFDNSTISISGIWETVYLNDTAGTCSIPIAVNKYTNRFTPAGDVIKYYMRNGDIVEFNTLQNGLFSGQPMGAFGVQTKQTSSTSREVVFDAIEMKRSSNTLNSKTLLYDVFLNTNATLPNNKITVTGELSSSNRTANGFTYVYFDLIQRAKVTYNNLNWSDSACCYPKSGTLDLAFDNYNSASPSAWPSSGKTASLSFTNTCGQATLTGIDGITNSYTFTECY